MSKAADNLFSMAGDTNLPLVFREMAGAGYAEIRRLEAEVERLHEWRDDFHRHALTWRGLDPDLNNICRTCGGSGVKTYGSSSTWRGGYSGQVVTRDVCDRCWGSGDIDRPGANLRKALAAGGE